MLFQLFIKYIVSSKIKGMDDMAMDLDETNSNDENETSSNRNKRKKKRLKSSRRKRRLNKASLMQSKTKIYKLQQSSVFFVFLL